ncbi:MAG: hypothetical protein WC612_04170 [Bdellovibrionales bacterium]
MNIIQEDKAPTAFQKAANAVTRVVEVIGWDFTTIAAATGATAALTGSAAASCVAMCVASFFTDTGPYNDSFSRYLIKASLCIGGFIFAVGGTLFSSSAEMTRKAGEAALNQVIETGAPSVSVPLSTRDFMTGFGKKISVTGTAETLRQNDSATFLLASVNGKPHYYFIHRNADGSLVRDFSGRPKREEIPLRAHDYKYSTHDPR